METMPMESFRRRYGENSAIAALAVVVEDEEIGKKRLIHDATHGVRVNHRIRCRDKLRAPGAREKKQLLLEMMERGELAFSVVGDISKAHTRFKHCEEEHGFLGCQIDEASDMVYVNLRGQLRQLLVDQDSRSGPKSHAPPARKTTAEDLQSRATNARGRMGVVLSYLYLSVMR